MTTTANLLKEFDIITIDSKVILYEFSKPLHQNVFFRNKEYLVENSKQKDFNKHVWDKNPQKFCLDEYENPTLYPIILLTNNIRSIFEFTREMMNSKIVAPTKMAITNILIMPRI